MNPFEKHNNRVVTLSDGKSVVHLPVLKDKDKIRITNLIITLAQTTEHLPWFASRLNGFHSTTIFEREIHYFKVYGVDTIYNICHAELRVGQSIELKTQLEIDASKLIRTCNLPSFKYQLKCNSILYIHADSNIVTCYITPAIYDEPGIIDISVWFLNQLGELKGMVEKLEQDILRAI